MNQDFCRLFHVEPVGQMVCMRYRGVDRSVMIEWRISTSIGIVLVTNWTAIGKDGEALWTAFEVLTEVEAQAAVDAMIEAMEKDIRDRLDAMDAKAFPKIPDYPIQ